MIREINFWSEVVPNWLSAIGTFGAVVVSLYVILKPAKKKPELKFVGVLEYISVDVMDIDLQVQVGEEYRYMLSVNLFNSGEGSALVQSWGYKFNGKILWLSKAPEIIEGTGVKRLEHSAYITHETPMSEENQEYQNLDYLWTQINSGKQAEVFVKFVNHTELKQVLDKKMIEKRKATKWW